MDPIVIHGNPYEWHLCIKMLGTFFVDRSSVKGRETIAAAAREARKKGVSVWLYPEGTRNHRRNGQLLPFKKGAFHLALDAGNIPILPVVVSQYDFLDWPRRRFEGGEATISVLEPIDTNGYGKDNIDELIEKVRGEMTKEFRLISNMEAK